MRVTLCALIAPEKSKAKKKPASLQAFLYLAPRPGLEQKNKHLFYNEIMLIFSIHIPTIILIKPVFYWSSFDSP